MATHSSILACRIPEGGAWQAAVHKAAESDMSEVTEQQQEHVLNADNTADTFLRYLYPLSNLILCKIPCSRL